MNRHVLDGKLSPPQRYRRRRQEKRSERRGRLTPDFCIPSCTERGVLIQRSKDRYSGVQGAGAQIDPERKPGKDGRGTCKLVGAVKRKVLTGGEKEGKA